MHCVEGQEFKLEPSVFWVTKRTSCLLGCSEEPPKCFCNIPAALRGSMKLHSLGLPATSCYHQGLPTSCHRIWRVKWDARFEATSCSAQEILLALCWGVTPTSAWKSDAIAGIVAGWKASTLPLNYLSGLQFKNSKEAKRDPIAQSLAPDLHGIIYIALFS